MMREVLIIVHDVQKNDQSGLAGFLDHWQTLKDQLLALSLRLQFQFADTYINPGETSKQRGGKISDE